MHFAEIAAKNVNSVCEQTEKIPRHTHNVNKTHCHYPHRLFNESNIRIKQFTRSATKYPAISVWCLRIHVLPQLTCFAGRIGDIHRHQIPVELPVQHTVGINHPEEYPVAQKGRNHDHPGPGAAVGRDKVGRQVLGGSAVLLEVLGVDDGHFVVYEVVLGVLHGCQGCKALGMAMQHVRGLSAVRCGCDRLAKRVRLVFGRRSAAFCSAAGVCWVYRRFGSSPMAVAARFSRKRGGKVVVSGFNHFC